MTYDFEKYRDKREKVLGVRKRGISFGTMAAVVAFTIIAGLSVIVVPKSVAYFNTRNLDDAIFKLEAPQAFTMEIEEELGAMAGIKTIKADSNGSRLVITLDTSEINTEKISSFFKQKKVATVLLNSVGHRQRMHTLEKEAAY